LAAHESGPALSPSWRAVTRCWAGSDMETTLLRTKLFIPPVRPEWVSRPHLVERLNEGLNGKLTLTSAPAGFGKTTLLSEWIHAARQHQTRPVRFAWISLDEDDNDPTRFLAYLIAAVQTVEAGIGEGMLGPYEVPEPPPLEPILTSLVNEIAVVQEPFVLVLDDYHTITAQAIHRALSFLLDYLPPQMHLVIATRADPPLGIAGLRGRGQLTELRQADLRFTAEEAADFLNQVMGLGLTADDVAALASRTEGWIAGLQMAAVSMRGREDVEGFVRDFAGSNRYVLDYLLEEVLQRQPEDVQTFLLQTSVLDRLSAPLCDAMLQGTGQDNGSDTLACPLAGFSSGQEILEYLERANLFVVPLDDRREWYRYHHLFADLLRQRLQHICPETMPELHRRASVWHERHGLTAEAIDHALSAGDFERAAFLIEQSAEATLRRGHFATFERWLGALPDHVIWARPLLSAYGAAGLLLAGHPVAEVETCVRHAEQGDADGAPGGEVAVLQAVLATMKGDAERGIELSQRALELLPESGIFFRGLVARNLGVAHKLTGDTAVAARALQDAISAADKAGDAVGVAVTMYQLAELLSVQGKLREARAVCERALDLAVERRDRPLLPIAIKGLSFLGMMMRESNHVEEAERCLMQAIELAGEMREIWSFGGYLYLARVRQAQGDMPGAHEAIQAAGRLAVEIDFTELDDIMVAAYQTRLWVAEGDLESAARWVAERGFERDARPGGSGGGIDSGSGPYHLREIEYTTLARVYIAQDRPDEAMVMLEQLLLSATRLGRMGSVIEILALQALALQAQGDDEQALAALQRALALAEPEGYVRVFADEGAPMAGLLQKALARGVSRRYAATLLSAFEGQAKAEDRSPGSAPGAETLVEPLSERELEVLRLLAGPLSSTDIANQLFISVNTVRSHIRSIYDKLDVHSRYEAVARAKELNLL
jgi:LuxR family maltose regulon positive regulatory protein